MNLSPYLSLSFLLGSAGMAFSDMACDVKGIAYLDEQGEWVEFTNAAPVFFDEIKVDFDTGVIVQGVFGNEDYDNREVLDHGSSESAFKVLSTSPRFADQKAVNAMYFQIDRYVEGAAKPFIAVQGHLVARGVCR